MSLIAKIGPPVRSEREPKNKVNKTSAQQ